MTFTTVVGAGLAVLCFYHFRFGDVTIPSLSSFMWPQLCVLGSQVSRTDQLESKHGALCKGHVGVEVMERHALGQVLGIGVQGHSGCSPSVRGQRWIIVMHNM